MRESRESWQYFIAGIRGSNSNITLGVTTFWNLIEADEKMLLCNLARRSLCASTNSKSGVSCELL